jgi:hypothetical protein
LTRHEQLVLCIALGLFVLGWAVKVYRAKHHGSSAAAVTITEPVKAKSDR